VAEEGSFAAGFKTGREGLAGGARWWEWAWAAWREEDEGKGGGALCEEDKEAEAAESIRELKYQECYTT
jgi:hypothetical protein